MPEVKELKRLNVAGSATLKETRKDFFLQWHLTERCNMACSHCYQSGWNGREMGLPAIRRTAAEVSEMVEDWAQRYAMTFAPSFNITGGEPFLRRDLFDILSVLASLRWQVYLLTNGTLINADKARRLAGLVQGVQVSLEGPEAIHDSIRGAGAFGAAVTGVEHLLDAGVAVNLNATISRLNVDHLDGLIAVARGLGVRRVGFSRLVPRGRGKELTEAMVPADRIEEVYRNLLSLSGGTLEVNTGDPVAALFDIPGDGDSGDVAFGGCAAGVSGLTLLADGTLTPCRRLPIPIGNIQNESLREVWVESPVLNALRDRTRYEGRCGRCPHWAICRGCRAVAHALGTAEGAEGYLADDPQCFVPLS
jgi:radical SAM protein with 4Fe4S-binding SPASM domain